jgi:hypothetical protein
MLEIIKMLVDGLTKAIPAIAKSRDKKKVKDTGALLFLVYIRLNEIIVTAESIIRSLEVYVERMEHHLATGEDAYALTAGSWISEKIERQQVNLVRAARLMCNSRGSLIMMDADSYIALMPLLDRKAGALWKLSGKMHSGTLVLSLSEEQVEFLRGEMEHPSRGLDFQRKGMRLLSNASGSRFVNSGDEWGEEVYTLVKEYLEERNPRVELASIRESVGALRTALLAQFSMDDILLTVGDERFDLPH